MRSLWFWQLVIQSLVEGTIIQNSWLTLSRTTAAAGLHICIEDKWRGEERRWRGMWDSKQVYSRADLLGPDYDLLLLLLPGFLLSCLLPCHPWASWWILTVTAGRQPPNHHPRSSTPLCLQPIAPLSFTVVQRWPQWPLFGSGHPAAQLRTSWIGGGAKCLSLAVKSTLVTWSATHPWPSGGQLCLSLSASGKSLHGPEKPNWSFTARINTCLVTPRELNTRKNFRGESFWHMC